MIATRLVTIRELEDHLRARGCEPLGGWRDIGRFWRRPDGRVFQVPLPEEARADPDSEPNHWSYRRYPDWLMWRLLAQFLDDGAPDISAASIIPEKSND